MELLRLGAVGEERPYVRAAERAGAEDLSRLKAEMLSYTDVPDRPAYESYRAMAAHDQRFHDLVLELSGNETARLSFARTHCHLHLFRLYYGGGIATKALREHKTIVTAVRKGDPEDAAAAMRAHIEASRARLRPIFDQE